MKPLSQHQVPALHFRIAHNHVRGPGPTPGPTRLSLIPRQGLARSETGWAPRTHPAEKTPLCKAWPSKVRQDPARTAKMRYAPPCAHVALPVWGDACGKPLRNFSPSLQSTQGGGELLPCRGSLKPILRLWKTDAFKRASGCLATTFCQPASGADLDVLRRERNSDLAEFTAQWIETQHT